MKTASSRYAHTRWLAAGAIAALSTLGMFGVSQLAFAGVPATTAEDVCPGLPPTCNVTQVYDVTPGATLDFKTSTVNITGTGQFNFDINNGSILSGPFNATTAAAAINAKGTGNNGTEGGTIRISARRSCSVAGSGGIVPCVSLSDCQLGACDTRRCTGRGTLHCLSDTTCAGTCTNKHCSNTPTFVRCAANADCNFGTCGQQLQCHNRDSNPVSCGADADCQFGTCSVGTASINLGGAITGNADLPASITLRAADDVTITKSINLTGSSFDSDGGDLTVEAAAGSINLAGKYLAPSGGDGAGGTIELDAALDVTINEEMTITGGDFDAGSADITAGRDIFVKKSIIANATAGAGFGGEIFMDADRDISIESSSSLSKTTIDTTGHTAADNSSGDGGGHDFTSGRDFSINANARLLGNGASPSGYGSEMSLDIGRNFVFNGGITAKSEGIHGQGGQLDVLVDGAANMNAGSTIVLTGGDEGGGDFGVESTGDMAFAGAADVSANTGGGGGTTFLYSDANTNIAGTLLNNSTSGGGHEVQACRITLTSTGKVDNNAVNGKNKLLVHETMKLLAGSEVSTGISGQNQLIYRSAAKPPIIQGTVTPAPQKIVDPTLVGCPVCGNGDLDQTETCDDGNTANGDGCSSLCQNEKCLAQTEAPGFPTVPLCDDADACTTDSCDTTLNGGTCVNVAKSCNDSIACTNDSCEAATGLCKHQADSTKCNDQNGCTTDFCSEISGCLATPNVDPCEDGSECTTDDHCALGVCTGTPVENCSVCGDSVKSGDEQCDDGDDKFVNGQYCAAGCVLVACGDTNNSHTITSGDALFTLKAAVQQATCDIHICDVDGSTKINATDALRVLRKAVQLPVEFHCPAVA